MGAVQSMPYVPDPPLRIEREYTLNGRETIIIEGVRYDPAYFRTFAHPDTYVLYSVQRRDDMVMLTIIRNEDEAQKFFEEVGGLDTTCEEHASLLDHQEEENDGL
ncbi:MAG: hypothetical protein HUU11_16840 [Anaerolineales bacterium]|nr:hypothetical protein [Anaerolineales bacterium]